MANAQIQMFAVVGGNTGALNCLVDTTYGVGQAIPVETKGLATSTSSTIGYLPARYDIYDCVAPDGSTGILQLYVDGSPTTIFVNLASSGASNPGRTKLSVSIPPAAKVEFRIVQAVTLS